MNKAKSSKIHTSIRMSNEINDRIDRLSKQMEWSKHQTLIKSIKIGLDKLSEADDTNEQSNETKSEPVT